MFLFFSGLLIPVTYGIMEREIDRRGWEGKRSRRIGSEMAWLSGGRTTDISKSPILLLTAGWLAGLFLACTC